MHSNLASVGSSVPTTEQNPVTSPRGFARATRRGVRSSRQVLVLAAIACLSSNAHASIFHGETLDKVANVMSWVVLVIVPIVAIGAFWMVHILPEKIAEKRKHPQAKAIQTLCLLSLVFGGMLWPLAWLWAYSKPVMYKLAYGTDVDETVGHGHKEKPVADKSAAREEELRALRMRIAELEAAERESGPKGRG